MLGTDSINLVPPLVEAGKFGDLVAAGQTISSTLSPQDNSLAVFITNTASSARFTESWMVLTVIL